MFFKRPMRFSELVNKVYPQGKINPNLLDYFGERRLDKINILMIEEYKLHRLKTVSNASVNRELAVIKHSYNQAMLWNLTRGNPCKGVKCLKETPRDRWLTYREEELILSHSPDWLKPIILLDVNTGLRLGEILNLKWSDINLESRTLKVATLKNGNPRVITNFYGLGN